MLGSSASTGNAALPRWTHHPSALRITLMLRRRPSPRTGRRPRARPTARPSPPDPAGPTGPWVCGAARRRGRGHRRIAARAAAERHAACSALMRSARSSSRVRRICSMPRQLRGGGAGQAVGVAHEPRHVGAVVVAERGELARHLQHRVHRVHPGLEEGDQRQPAHTARAPRGPAARRPARRVAAPAGRARTRRWGRCRGRRRPPAGGLARRHRAPPAGRGGRTPRRSPRGTSVLLPRVMPLRDHLASQGSPTHRARSMP